MSELNKLAAMMPSTPGAPDNQFMEVVIPMMDTDKNGKVNADEIMAFFSKMGGASPVTDKKQAEAMIAAVDPDGDGELNEAEMAKMSAAGGAPPAASGDGAKSNDGQGSGV